MSNKSISLNTNTVHMVDDRFTNQQVDVHTLPRSQDLDMEGLDKRYLQVELILNTVLWFILFSAAVILLWINPSKLPGYAKPIIIGALVMLAILSYVITFYGFKKKKYALREKDIIYQSGLVWRAFTALPFNRIQHAEIHQGPVERLFELSSLKIYTAGGSSSDLSIKGLSLDHAQVIKSYILTKSTADEEE